MNACIVRSDPKLTSYKDSNKISGMIENAFYVFLRKKYGTDKIKNIFFDGCKIVIKPNFVHEMNFRVLFDKVNMDNPDDCFTTNLIFIDTIVKILSKTNNLTITILECPLQSCDVGKIISEPFLEKLRRYNIKNIIRFIDARRTRYYFQAKEPKVVHNLRDESEYIDFDLADESCHRDYEKYYKRFRVTDYPPKEMLNYHKEGMHKYRIAKDAIDSDFVISIPKLKTHMKAGITCAMKNFVGVVGNKECLPHHIKGSPLYGGDCYGDFSLIKMCAEEILDKANGYLVEDEKRYYKIKRYVDILMRIRRILCLDSELTGSWYGNDTISRSVVDLNYIIYYGGVDGILHDSKQRQVISIVDGIVSGQGEGPMKPFPNNTGIIVVSDSTALADAVSAELIGVDSTKLSFLYNDRIYSKTKYPIIENYFSEAYIEINGNVSDFFRLRSIYRPITVSPRWEGHIEKEPTYLFSYKKRFIEDLIHYPRRIKHIFNLFHK